MNGNVIDPASLAALNPTQRAMFFLNFYDGLMNYSGTGHVDWWMGATGWSPALAAEQTALLHGAKPVTVGMLDFTVTSGTEHGKGALLQYGALNVSNGHGDRGGKPDRGFDGRVEHHGRDAGRRRPTSSSTIPTTPRTPPTGPTWARASTRSATSIFGNGSTAPTGVLNASLGVPGWTLNPGWNGALASGLSFNHNLVIAAGNEGVTQTSNVPWDFTKNATILIVVGSVGLDGTISNFSNRPGEACLVSTSSAAAACSEADKLKYRFIVAPGELILVRTARAASRVSPAPRSPLRWSRAPSLCCRRAGRGLPTTPTRPPRSS